MSAPVRNASFRQSATHSHVVEVQMRRRSNAAGAHGITRRGRGTVKAANIAASLAEWGF
jgi:hypothetical protein